MAVQSPRVPVLVPGVTTERINTMKVLGFTRPRRRGLSRVAPVLLAAGIVAGAGAGALLAPPASADPQSEAQTAINGLLQKIDAGHADRGFNSSGLGASTSGVEAVGDGFRQNFSGGSIFWSEATGAHVIYGAVNAKYAEEGGPTGSLGFPTGDETAGPFKPTSRMAPFAAADKPVIYWTPSDGAWVVRGPFSAAVGKLGTELGAPTADLTTNGNVLTQRFADATLSYDKSTGAWTSTPDASLAAKLSGIAVPGMTAPTVGAPTMTAPTVTAPTVAAPSVNTGSSGISPWWWLLLPLALLLLGLLWWLGSRRRRTTLPTVKTPAVKTPTVKTPDVSAKRIAGTAAAGAAGAAGVAGAAAAKGKLHTDGFDEALVGGNGSSTYSLRGVSTPVPLGAHLPLAGLSLAPDGYPIKGNANSGLYHTPDMRSYRQTKAEIWFESTAAAEAAGFSRARTS